MPMTHLNAGEQTLEVMILVKAAPVLTTDLEEAMCIAAMTTGPDLQRVRLYPVPFRDLADEEHFRKYQTMIVGVKASRRDRRPESWLPIRGSIRTGKTLGTRHGWSARKERIRLLGDQSMCDLNATNQRGSGPGVPSLGVVRPVTVPKLKITPLDETTLKERMERAEASANQPSLFDDATTPRAPLEVVPWRFRGLYNCHTEGCTGHAQTIVDWEIVVLGRRVRHLPDWQDRIRRKYVNEMWGPDRDPVLFVGNQEQHPGSFLVLGVFWPPTGESQMPLDLPDNRD